MTKREVVEGMQRAQERRTERQVLVVMTAFGTAVVTAIGTMLLLEGEAVEALLLAGVAVGWPLLAEWRKGRQERAEWGKLFREARVDLGV